MTDYERLLEMLDIEDPSGFEYFENMADLIETEEEFSDEAIARLLIQVDGPGFAAILEEYFSELLKGVPDSETELYTLLQTIGLSLCGMSKTAEGEQKAVFCDEFLRFKKWYTGEKSVAMREDGGKFDPVSLMDALTFVREERLTPGKNYEFDFEDALEYELSDYVISFSDIAGEDSRDAALRNMEAAEVDSPEALLGKITSSGGSLPEGFLYDDELSEETKDI